MKANTKTILTAVLAGAAVLLLLAAALLLSGRHASAPEPSPTPSAVLPAPTAEPDPAPSGTPEPTASVMPEVVDGLKVGTWPITQERRDYVDGSLELYIPAIGITRTIWDGTDAQTLSKGVGLYEYAQLPGEGNRNVSLAGHRNGLDKNGNVTDHAPFYYVDTLGEGDYFYLTGGGCIYRYLYDDTWVVEAPWLQRLMANVNFSDYESRSWFDRQLRASGLFDKLEAMGIQDGDTVSLYDLEFEYQR